MTKKETLSYSQKKVRSQCKRKWYLKYYQEIDEIDSKSEALLFGSYVHSILEKYLRKHYVNFASHCVSESSLRRVTSEALFELDSRLSSDLYFLGFDLAFEGLKALRKDFKKIYIFQDKPAIELELTVKDFYTGIIDLVYMDTKGKIVLLDWKTTSWLYTNHQVKNSEQLVGYAWLLQQNNVTVDMIGYGVLHKKDVTAKLMKVRNTQNYRDFVKGVKQIKISDEHFLRLHRGKSTLSSFPRNEESCYMYRSQCLFYETCWGEDNREVEVVE